MAALQGSVLGRFGASRVVPPPLFWQVLKAKALATLQLDHVGLLEEGARQLAEALVQLPFSSGCAYRQRMP